MTRLVRIKRFYRIHPKRAICSALLIIVGVSLLLFFLFRTQPTGPIIPSTTPSKTVSTNADKQIAAQTSNNSSVDTNSSKSNASSTPSSSFGAAPAIPYGDFVSNHSPGGPNPNQETSVCNTTPGASCYIEFTQGSSTKNLAIQTTDANGAAYWNWDASILDSGTWTIKAVATLNGHTESATDSRPLVVP